MKDALQQVMCTRLPSAVSNYKGNSCLYQIWHVRCTLEFLGQMHFDSFPCLRTPLRVQVHMYWLLNFALYSSNRKQIQTEKCSSNDIHVYTLISSFQLPLFVYIFSFSSIQFLKWTTLHLFCLDLGLELLHPK